MVFIGPVGCIEAGMRIRGHLNKPVNGNIRGQEFVIETKVYYSPGKFESGKRQLAYYCQSLGLTTGLYLVFCPNNIAYPDIVREGKEDFDGTTIKAYIIPYDEERWD